MRRGIPYRAFCGWDASRRIAPMGQCGVQIQAGGGRAEPIHWKSCLVPLIHGLELVCSRCGIPAVVVSFLLIDCLVDYLLHAVTRLPDANSHSCRMLRTNAPRDIMPHLSYLGCEPARCGHWAARVLEFKRTVGVPHGVRKRRGLNAIFWPPTGFSRDARVRFGRDAGLSCRWMLAR